MGGFRSGDTVEGPAGPSQQQGTGCLPPLDGLPVVIPETPGDGTTTSCPQQSPPNFLRASALAEHVKPVVVIPEEAPEDEEPENLIEISTSSTEPQVGAWGEDGDLGTGTCSLAQLGTLCLLQVTSDIFEQTFGPPNGIRDDRYGGPWWQRKGGHCCMGPTCLSLQGCADREPEEGGGHAPCRDGED